MTDCHHCHKPMKPAAANMLCPDCRTDYWTMIHQLGHVQLPALRSIMPDRRNIGPTGHTPSKGNAPLPIDVHAQALIAESEAWLAEQAGKIRPQYADYRWRKAWCAIISNRHTVLNMSTAADDYTNLQHIVRRNEQALTPEEELIILGTAQNATACSPARRKPNRSHAKAATVNGLRHQSKRPETKDCGKC